MRDAFARELEKITVEDERVILLMGDIGNRMFDKFKELSPDKFYNCGIAEANMIGVAAGLALEGYIPVVYTIAPFATVRCLEQIRIDVCYHNLPVIIAGTGAGLSYAPLGPTHHSLDDISLLKNFPNMNIICPADAAEVRMGLRAAIDKKAPAYLRLGKKGEPVVFEEPYNFKIGTPKQVLSGDDVCILSVGNVMPVCMQASEMLKNKGVGASVYSYHTVKPLNENFLAEIFDKYKIICTVEEHYLCGGAGSSLAEWMVDNDIQKRLRRFGVSDTFMSCTGSQDYARGLYGITAENIAETVLREFK